MRKMRSPIVYLSLTAVVVIAIARVASASLFLPSIEPSGPSGTVVHVRTGGKGACVVCPHRMPLFFAQSSDLASITAPDDSRLVRVGQLIVDERGNGSGAFTGPEVPMGRYVVMTACEPCAPDSAGRVILPLGPFPPFRVIGSSVGRSAPNWLWIAGGLLGILVAAFAWIRVRRGSRRPRSPRATAGR
jgi:hypothetical protein